MSDVKHKSRLMLILD